MPKWVVTVLIEHEIEVDLYATGEEAALGEAEGLWADGLIDIDEGKCRGGEVDCVEAISNE